MSDVTETSSEDYLDIELENFNGSSDPGAGMDSYLRLGAEDAAVTHGQDLAEKITTYIDDSRIRGPADDGGSAAEADNTFRTLSQAERAVETALLATKGGWRDHTDGNRITTTRGDKVEVIRGNYKLLVLGREQWRDDAGVGLNYESSGGITYHFDEVPGQIVDVRWEFEDEINTWRVIEECDKGHVVQRYHGVDKDWIQGGDFVTRIGSLEAFDSTASSGDPDQFETDDHFDKPVDASHNASFEWPSADALPNVREEVYAYDIYDKCVAGSIVEHLGSATRKLDSFDDDQCVHFLMEDHNFNSYEAKMIGDSAIEVWCGPVYFENFMGAQISTKSAIFADLRLAGFITEVNVGILTEVNLAGAIVGLELVFGSKLDVAVSAWMTECDLGLLKFKKEPDATIDITGLRSLKTASWNLIS